MTNNIIEMVRKRVNPGTSLCTPRTLAFIGFWVFVLFWMMQKIVQSIHEVDSPLSSITLRGSDSSYRQSYLFDANILKHCNHLIVVCGHAITVAESLDSVQSTDSVW